MEIWYPVRDWEGLYEVTKSGKVRSLDRVSVDRRGRVRRIKGSEKSTERPGSRYPGIEFASGGVREVMHLHRLLAEMFVPNPDNLPVVRHLNDNPRDYRLENLAWGTQADNLQDLYNNRGHYNTLKTHCKRGHPFDEKNTYWTKKGGRVCRVCRDNHVKEWHRRRRDNER